MLKQKFFSRAVGLSIVCGALIFLTAQQGYSHGYADPDDVEYIDDYLAQGKNSEDQEFNQALKKATGGLEKTNIDIPHHKENAYRVILDPRRTTLLSTEVNTRVRKIYKRMGDSFKQGEILIQLDDDIFIANLKKAKAQLDKAKTELDAKKQLFAENSASLFDVKDAEAALASAEADFVLAKKNYQASKIIAPYDGKVVALGVEEDELPKAGKEVIEVVDDSTLDAKFLLPSSALDSLAVGTPVRIKLAENGAIIKAKISRIGAIIDPASSTIKLEAEVDNSKGDLKGGMTGTVDIGKY